MSHGDPRRVQGKIVGDDDPFGENSVIIDMKNALMLEGTNVALVGGIRKGIPIPEELIALELQGRINQTEERIPVMVVVGVDGAAALVTELIGVASRAGFAKEFMELVEKRMEEMPK